MGATNHKDNHVREGLRKTTSEIDEQCMESIRYIEKCVEHGKSSCMWWARIVELCMYKLNKFLRASEPEYEIH